MYSIKGKLNAKWGDGMESRMNSRREGQLSEWEMRSQGWGTAWRHQDYPLHWQNSSWHETQDCSWEMREETQHGTALKTAKEEQRGSQTFKSPLRYINLKNALVWGLESSMNCTSLGLRGAWGGRGMGAGAPAVFVAQVTAESRSLKDKKMKEGGGRVRGQKTQPQQFQSRGEKPVEG